VWTLDASPNPGALAGMIHERWRAMNTGG